MALKSTILTLTDFGLGGEAWKHMAEFLHLKLSVPAVLLKIEWPVIYVNLALVHRPEK